VTTVATAAHSAHRVPAWRVLLAGRDISGLLRPRLIRLSLAETRGDEADQLDIEIDDADGQLVFPERGAVLHLALGWTDTALTERGSFTVDEVEYSPAPGRFCLRARSADLSSDLRILNERSFHRQRIGDIVATIAADHGLTPVVGEQIAAITIDHIDQSNESDANFLNRIGQRYDTVATVKDGRLLFIPIAAGQTASGADTPTTVLRLAAGDAARFHLASRDSYSGVEASWQGKGETTRHRVLVGVRGNAKRLRTLYGSQADALAAARAEWARICRGQASFEMRLAHGRPDLSVQGKLHLPELKAPLDDIIWLIARLTHELSEGGLTTRIEGETADEGTRDAQTETEAGAEE